MERILSQRLNAFLLSHNKSEDEQEKAKMRRSLRRDLRSAQLRIVNKHWETEPDFDEEATITTVGFYFEGKRLTLVKIETNLRRLDLREFVRFDYAVGDINITAVMRPKDEIGAPGRGRGGEKHRLRHLRVRSGRCILQRRQSLDATGATLLDFGPVRRLRFFYLSKN